MVVRCGLEVDVFDAQAQCFEQPHAGAVEQADDEAVGVCRQVAQQGGGFSLGEDGGQVFAGLCAGDAVQPWQVSVQDFLVQKQQGGQGLVLGAG